MSLRDHWIYAVPLLPIAARAAVIARFRRKMGDVLKEEEHDREGHRTLIIAFAGFSFTGVVALVLLESTLRQTLKDAVFFLLVSFSYVSMGPQPSGVQGHTVAG